MGNEQVAMATPRTAAGVIFTDEQARILMVHTTYKDYWDVPGGYVEPGESPREAAQREVREELGLSIEVGKLLAVDWAPSEAEGDKLLFLFAGPRLPQDVAFKFSDGEIDEARYVEVDDLAQYTIERLARRLWSALNSDVTYLEHGEPVSTS
ncbi:NUDIX hydrolase [Amycolatopsis pithecellobii]|uniref:NUDIX hydrolase n=1 Tax=Amycolatopsis pithecellobii TaxID=664692 RepID=UPI0028ADF4DB|nr:NUDIX hydrolase [Amycolatopsis pithecellobii]